MITAGNRRTAVGTLDEFVQRAGTAAFGGNATVFIWISMAYASLVTLLITMAVTVAWNDRASDAEHIAREILAHRCNDERTAATSAAVVVVPEAGSTSSLHRYVHYLEDDDAGGFYAPSALSSELLVGGKRSLRPSRPAVTRTPDSNK